MHHCINTRQITIITAALCYQPSNCSLQHVQHPFNQTQTADRGSQEEGRGPRLSGNQDKIRHKEWGKSCQGWLESDFKHTKPPPQGENKLLDKTRDTGRLLSDEKMQREQAVLSKRQTALHNDYSNCPPGLLHKNWDLRN